MVPRAVLSITLCAKMKKIAIVGGGPAGLMAAQASLSQGYDVHLFEAMPSLGRKFLMAGKSGMNLTHNEDFDLFLTRYKDNEARIHPLIQSFSPKDIQLWAANLGIETFVGSSGRIFPTDFKAAPLLRAWIRDLKSKGLTTHVRHRWVKADTYHSPDGEKHIPADATIFAMGAISWPKLGSNGNWIAAFDQSQIKRTPFKASNCGFDVDWSPSFMERFAGEPVKAIAINGRKGEFVISKTGVEGSAIYTHSRALRQALEAEGTAQLILDLTPDRTLGSLKNALQKSRGSKSLSTHLKRQTGLSGVKAALLRECLDKETFQNMEKLAQSIKALLVELKATRPIEEAISCTGGVSFDQLDDNLMVKDQPGTFMAGEMLDWDAPTGGYLLTACFALGQQAGRGAVNYLNNQ